MRACHKGFTLIELLVIIAIITNMAIILSPAFTKAREKANMAACLSNEKKINFALMQYVQDNDKKYFPLWGSGPSWAVYLDPYVKNRNIVHCPSDSYVAENPDAVSYLPNQSLGQYPLGCVVAGVPYAAIKSPSKFITMMEDDESFWRMYNTYSCSDYANTFIYCQGQRHSGGDNIIFADGHAKWYRDLWNASGQNTDPFSATIHAPYYISLLVDYDGN